MLKLRYFSLFTYSFLKITPGLYTAMPEDSTDKPNIVTCTAPVNIAVIKYCKYHLDLCFASYSSVT